MDYYRISSDIEELRNSAGEVVGKGGEVIALATDSADKRTRRAAQGVLMGNHTWLTKTSKPPKASKKKAANKANYETREMTPEASAPATDEKTEG
jgi:hypothetical protein